MESGCATSGSTMRKSGPQLPAAVQLYILTLLPFNDRALSGRLVSPDARDALSGASHRAVSLSQPLPQHAAVWAQGAWQQHTPQLAFRHKAQLLSTAAASGCETNLEVAWTLLAPSIFPEVLQERQTASSCAGDLFGDPGEAAVRAGHPRLLGWLARRCPGLLLPRSTALPTNSALLAAARHSSLAVLQEAHQVLSGIGSGSGSGSCCLRLDWQVLLDAAAESISPDAVAKLEWVLAAGGANCRLQEGTAAAAARSGDPARLAGLRDRGCPMGGRDTLPCAVAHADLEVAEWLVDEVGCKLPECEGDDDNSEWEQLYEAAAKSSDAVAKWQWLQERGGPPLHPDVGLPVSLPRAAVKAGQVEAVRHLLDVFGLDMVAQCVSSEDAAASGSIPMPWHCARPVGHSRTRPTLAPPLRETWPWSGGWRWRRGCPPLGSLSACWRRRSC